jgi:F0F1-type ATP synthase membrane subunit b/b'
LNEQTSIELVDLLLAICGFLLATVGRVMWQRINKIEDKLTEQTRELHQAIDHQGAVFREEHGKLREQMTKQHEHIVEILIQTRQGSGQ